MHATRAFARAALAVALLAVPTPAEAVSYSFAPWVAGYVNDYGYDTGRSFEGVEMTFTMPPASAACNAGQDVLAVWVGLGYDHTTNRVTNGWAFTQNGLNINGTGHAAWAWFEWFASATNAPVTSVPFTASPGDTIRLREIWGPAHYTVYAIWRNLTTGLYVMRPFNLGSRNYPSGADGDWLMERLRGEWAPDQPRVPWFGRLHITRARLEQASIRRDRHGVPVAASYIAAQAHPHHIEQNDMNNWNDPTLKTVDARPGATAQEFSLVQQRCT